MPAAGRIVAQVVRTPGPFGTWADETEYLHDDHLGSTHVVTDDAGAVVRTIAYDPWGQARTGDNWLVNVGLEALDELGIGFTGHAARLDADLVDMGGRSYHPRLGRFFSPDPLVVSPLDAQAYNRYAYVHNRPLVFTDPTGYAPQGLGADGQPDGNDAPPPGTMCVDGNLEFVCTRSIVVGSESSMSMGAWNDAVQFFELTNGSGQRGPQFNGGTPYSPNGHRHANDHGQPGGTPVFTIAVTEDMCAQIAACSGGLSKREPSRIWHAPIDEWAETAADIATDMIPGVSHAKTAYDAYQRLQNGDPPLDVLMSAGGDAVLGLLPGLKAGKKIGKALDKVEDAADAAGDVADAAGDVGRAARGGKHNTPRSTLPRAGSGDYLPDPEAAGRSHTTLGARVGRRGSYTQGATFDASGRFRGVTDVTSHGRGHPNPHFHPAKGSNRIEHGPHPLPSPDDF